MLRRVSLPSSHLWPELQGGERPDRKQAILLAAEKLFAQHGYHAVTIRQIAQEAEVPLALVGYYYGAKQDLFHAIFAHWGQTVQARLTALRDALEQAPSRRLAAIVDAFISPVLKLRASPEGEYYALLVARELLHASPQADRVLHDYFDPMAQAFIAALHTTLPHASHSDVAWAYQFALGSLLHHISDTRIERLSRGKAHALDTPAQAMLARFIVGGIRAALPKPAAQ